MAEVKKLLAAAEKTEWYTLVYVAIATGMRQGELFGLTWDAVHLDKSYLRVTRALARTEDGYALGEPKTAAFSAIATASEGCRDFAASAPQETGRESFGTWCLPLQTVSHLTDPTSSSECFDRS